MEPAQPDSPGAWTNRRILTLLALGTFIVSLIWHLPQEISYLTQRAGEIIFALVLAMAVTYLLRPAVNALNRTRFFGYGSRSGRSWATLAVFVAGAGLLYGFVLVGLKPVAVDVREMWVSFVPSSPQEAKTFILRWKQKLAVAIQPYQALLPPETTEEIQQSLPRLVAGATRSIGRWLSHSFSHAGFLIELILIPVLVFYFLTDGPALRAELRLLAAPTWRPRLSRMAAHFDRVLDGYTRGQVIMCLLAWVLVTSGLLLLHVPHAFTLGLIAGITRAVPVIGPILGGVPLVLVCLLTTMSLPITLTLLVGFAAMHFLESKLLLPKIVGHEVDLHPVSVIVALLVGMEFFGFLGVFLAVPLAAVLKIVLTEWHASYPRPVGAALPLSSADGPSPPVYDDGVNVVQ
jgi:predicted PurR-regulated permease PerM